MRQEVSALPLFACFACAPNPAFIGPDGVLTTSATDETASDTATLGDATEASTSESSGDCETPSFEVDFTAGVVDPRLVFHRGSTATFVDSTGVIQPSAAEQPRFDHACAPECDSLGLLVEDARTNELATDFALWAPSNSSIVANAGTAPDGTNTAWALTDAADEADHHVELWAPQWFDGERWTYSVFAKADALTELRLLDAASPNFSIASYDLAAGIVSGTQSGGDGTTVVDAGMQSWPGGWWRLWLTIQPAAGADRAIRIGLLVEGTEIYAGAGESLLVWGPQLERGGEPSSFIPTADAPPRSRTEDVALVSDLTWLDPTRGTLVLEFSRAFALAGDEWVMQLGDQSGANFFAVRAIEPAAFAAVMSRGGVEQGRAEFAFVAGARQRVALAYETGSWAASADGSPVATFAGIDLPEGISKLDLGASTPASVELGGHIAALRYYPCRRSDDDLRMLTAP